MARRVLAGVCFRTLLIAIGLAAALPLYGAAQSGSGACAMEAASIPADHRQQAVDFLSHSKASPFYKELVRRRGKATGCQLAISGNNLTVSFEFRGGARLEAKANPKIEYSEQRMELRGLTRSQAMALLKAGEKQAWGAKGCGIRWHVDEDSPGDQPGSHEVVYRGNNCNCQGRMVYEKKSVLVALVLRSAC
jgi:hypothetical protein